MTKDRKIGLAFAIATYTIWGSLPIFWKTLSAVPSAFVQVNRMFWGLVFVLIFCLATKKMAWHMFKDKRVLFTFAISGALITCNWTTYIITVNSGNVVEASLGYYITPLLNIIVGLVFFKEKLSPVQVVATILAAGGIAYFSFNYGHFPFAAVFLSLTFAAYGAVKKWGAYPPSEGMFVESWFTGLAGLLGIGIAFIFPDLAANLTPITDVSPLAWQDGGAVLLILLVLAGLFTWIPLQTFAVATSKIPMSWIGFCQYWSPTLSLILGVFLFGEAFTFAHGVMFACIWGGFLLIAIEAFIRTVKNRKPQT